MSGDGDAAAADTIFALASPPGRGAVAVVRLSGPRAGAIAAALGGRLPQPRRAVVRRLRDPESGETLDRALLLWFPGPRSYTGEDVTELHLHGGPAVVAAVLGTLSRQAGLRLAEPGEFTRRAFHAGRLDLTAVEGLADLIAAETEAQRRQAQRQADGALATLYDGWQARLVRGLAHLEAAIDFADDDLPEGVGAEAHAALAELQAEIAAHLDDGRRGERLRHGLALAIVGPPNAGKSSLLNLLARREAAIVASSAGTTRDVVEVHLDLGGYPVRVADTAGLRATADAVEAEGVRRAERVAAAADLRLVVVDASAADAGATAARLADRDAIVVWNKVDLAGAAMPPAAMPGGAAAICAVSLADGRGLEGFCRALEEAVRERIGLAAAPGITRARHREALEAGLDALARAQEAPLPELAAEDVRLALRALARIVGRVDVEELLDVVFRDFCIGK